MGPAKEARREVRFGFGEPGEVPDDEKLYWGLDAQGAPAIVIAGF